MRQKQPKMRRRREILERLRKLEEEGAEKARHELWGDFTLSARRQELRWVLNLPPKEDAMGDAKVGEARLKERSA